MLDEIGSPNLQIILDPVNLLDISNYQDQEAIVEEAIEVLGPDVAMVHLKDYMPTEGKLEAMACGLGRMQYGTVLKFIKERKPCIHVTLENTTPENNQQARDHILELYRNV